MNHQVYFPLFLLCFLKIFPGIFSECFPEVEIEKCRDSKNQSNPYWNLDRNRQFTISLNVKKSCERSVIKIQWLLEKKDTRRIFRDMRKYNDKQVLIIDAFSLPVGEYILLARVRESAYSAETGTVEKQCWIRIVKNLPKFERIAPRTNGSFTNDYTLPVETNTVATGWIYCSNPEMFILTSPGSRPPVNIFFGEIATFDKWVNERTKWIVGRSWSWVQSRSWTRSWTEKLAIGTRSRAAIQTASTRHTSRMRNSTGYVAYPPILNDSFPRRSFYTRHGRELDMITGLDYNKKYRFLLCEHGDLYNVGCRNISELTTCPNYARMVTCNPDVSDKFFHNSYGDVIGLKCTTVRTMPKHLSFGLYSIDGRAPYAKGPKDIMIGHFTDYTAVYFRLYARFSHTVNLRPIDYSTYVRFPCNDVNCKNSMSTFKIASDVLELIDLPMQARLSKLIEARDGKFPCKECSSKLGLAEISFSRLTASRKIGDAVQLALSLLKDSEMIIMKDVERAKFQTAMLDDLAKITDWTWPNLELMVGLLPYFSMEGVSKEIGHTKAKGLLLKNMVASIRNLIINEKHPLMLQVKMEKIFFPCLFRELSQMFDADYVKPFTFPNVEVESPPFHGGRREEYEDYGDNIDETILDDYINLANNTLETLFALLFSRSKTHHYKEDHLTAQEKSVTSKMWLEYQNIDYMKTQVNDMINIKFRPSADIPPQDKEFRFIWALIGKDAFFWHKDGHDLKTPLVFFKLYYGDEEKKKFDASPVIQMKTSDVSIQILHDGIVVPSNPNDWTSDIMDRFIRAYRINVDEYLGQSLSISISDIFPVKRLMMIVNQGDRKPRLDDFLNPTSSPVIFNDKNTGVILPVTAKGYWYIALLPYREDVQDIKHKRSVNTGTKRTVTPFAGKKQVQTVGVNYNFSFTMYGCPVYVNNEFKYDACSVMDTSTLSQIDCECKEIGSPLAARVDPVAYKIYGIHDVQTRLELTVEYVIIAYTLVAIFLYCFLLVITPYRSKPMELIYFLSDNAKQSRFGYLVRVRTADFRYAGTTAHIGIQLYGSNSNSRRHILNYPDPSSMLLRTASVDHFLMATNESLGNINRIEMWSDCSGSSPDWYCESVRVYDIQKYVSWHFNIQKWFSVQKGHYCHYYVKPTHPKDVTVRTPWVYFDLYFGANNSWNIIDRSHDQYWLYMERLTVLLSHLLSTFALALYFIDPPWFEYQDGIGVSHYNDTIFYVKTIAIVTAIVAPINYLFSVFLRGSYKSGRFRGRYGYFPTYYAGLTWIALLIIIILCLVYCLVYGPFISAAVVYDWIVVVVLSLLINIFFCENIFLAIHGIIRVASHYLNAWATTIGTNYLYKEIITDVETQRKFLYRRMDRRGVRPYIRHLYIPLGGHQLIRIQERNRRRLEIQQIIWNMCILCTMVIFLVLMLIFHVNEISAEMSEHLRDMFVYGNYSTPPMGIHDVYTHDDVYQYLNTTLIRAITPRMWYLPYFVSDSGLLSDINNKVVGNTRIRQQRTVTVECPQYTFAKSIGVTECIATFTNKRAMKNSSFDNILKHNKSMWWYHKEQFWNSYPGHLEYYNGDGYAINIGKTRANALYRVQLLKDNEWLDDHTKFIIIEMLLYNANKNLFADVKLVWEREAKYMHASYDINVITLLTFGQGLEKWYILVFALYAAISARMLFSTLERMCVSGFAFLKSWHNVGLIIFSILNVYSIVLFFLDVRRIGTLLHSLNNEDRNSYFPYTHIVSTHRELEITLAAMIFVTILLLLQFMQFVTWTASTLLAMRKAFPLFFNIMLYIAISLVCFEVMARIFFESTLEEFYHFLNGSVFFLLMFTRFGDSELWRSKWHTSGYIVIWFYICMFIMVLMAKIAFFMICTMYLHMCRKDATAIRYRYTLWKYLGDLFMLWRQRINAGCAFMRNELRSTYRRTRGGQDWEEFVIPGPDSYRYRHAVYVCEWRMQKQQQVAVAYLRNNYVRQPGTELTKLDTELMKGIADFVVLQRAYCQDLYFKQRKPFAPITTTILIPDKRMRKMAYITAHLLESKTDEKQTLEDPEDKEVGEEKPQQPPKEEEEASPEKPKNLTDYPTRKSTVHSQTKQLQGLLVILDISNDVVDTIGQKLLGPFSFAHLPKIRCCEDDED